MRYAKLASILLLLPFVGVVSCAQQEAGTQGMEMSMAEATEAFETAMNDARAAWTAAYEAGDAASVAAKYSDDAIYLIPDMPAVTGRAAIEQAFAEVMGMTAGRDITINVTDFGVSGDLGYMVGTYVLMTTAEQGAEPTSREGSYVTIVKRAADGSWKIQTHIYNYDEPVEMT